MDSELLQNFFKINKRRRSFVKRMLEEYSLCGSMNMILVNINKVKSISQDELLDLLLIDKATLSREVKKLKEMNYLTIKADPENRRKNILMLTSAGEELAEKIVNENTRVAKLLLRDFTPEEAEMLSAFLRRMGDNSDKLVQ